MKRTLRSLNGAWRYAVNGKRMGLMQVPFSAACMGDSVCALRFDADAGAPRSFLCFEGVTYQATVTFNGKRLGVMGPYSFYSFEVTDILMNQGNELSVSIRDMNLSFGPSEGWENYGGIIRDVYLLQTPTVRIDDFIWRTSLSEDFATAACEIAVEVSGGEAPVSAVLYDRHGFVVSEGETQTDGGRSTLTLALDRPNLWSPDMPYLYTLSLRAGEDEVIKKMGVKDFRIEGQRFVLNGKPLYLKGVAWALIGVDECADWTRHAVGYFGEMIELTLRRIQSNDLDVLKQVNLAIENLEAKI